MILSERLEMIKELSLTQCKCKEVKKRGHTFCTRCYGMLPQSLRDRLYRRLGEGYEEAYQESVKRLFPENLDAAVKGAGVGGTAPRAFEG